MSRFVILFMSLALLPGLATGCGKASLDEVDTAPPAASDSGPAGDATADATVSAEAIDPDPATAAAEPDDAVEPAATADATQLAVAENFGLPIKGDPEALVVIYEFSDYL